VRHPALRAVTAALLFTAPLAAQERHVLTGSSATIWNLAGDIRLEPGTGSDVAVEITRGGSDGERLTVNASGGQLRVRYPSDEIVYRDGRSGRSSTTLSVRDDGSFGGSMGSGRRTRIRTSGSGLEAHADMRISVPRGKRVEINLAIGEITVTNVDGDLRLDVHAASVRATGTKGRLMVDAGSGSVRVDESEGELEVDTGSGSTTVVGFRGRSMVVDAGSGGVEVRDVTVERFHVDVGSGRVRAENLAAEDLDIDTGSGSVDVALTTVPRASLIDTGSGGVRLTLPAAANADLDFDTGSGRISTEFAVTMDRIERRALRGQIGTGGPTIRIDTGSGGIALLKR
jgi:hypothetical protein